MQVHVEVTELKVKVLTHEEDEHSPVISEQEVQLTEQLKQLF